MNKINWFEFFGDLIENIFMTPIFIFGIIVSLVFWGLLLLLILPFSKLTFFIHRAEKKYLKHKDEEFDKELDELIEKLQIETIVESMEKE